jgi:hypothetical protein
MELRAEAGDEAQGARQNRRMVGEIGCGMWKMGGWKDPDDDESRASLERSIELGCAFLDTAWVCGDGHSERMLGELVRGHPLLSMARSRAFILASDRQRMAAVEGSPANMPRRAWHACTCRPIALARMTSWKPERTGEPARHGKLARRLPGAASFIEPMGTQTGCRRQDQNAAALTEAGGWTHLSHWRLP